jgi:hypothetical protein
MMSGTPIIKEPLPGRIQQLNTFLDEHLLPYPVRFLTNRVIILATLALLIPLIFFTSNQAFVNSLNSYLNVMSVVVSSTVLLDATIADVRDRAAAKRAEELAKAYEQLLEERVQGREQELEERVQGREELAKAYEQLLEERVQGREKLAKAYEQKLEKRVQEREQELEKRVQADHELIEQILQNSVENILGGRLEKIRLEDHKKLEEMQKAVIASNETLRRELAEKARLASNETLRRELAELRELVQALHQSRFGNPENSEG